MRVSWNWLNELVEIKITPEALAELMTMSGVAVEGIEYLQKGIKNVKVGLIEEAFPHPQADKLTVCRVETGQNERWTIVCGAANVKAGQMVPVALPGAVLPGGKQIVKANLRGMDSEGMICSAVELGLEVDKLPQEQKEGIYTFNSDVSLGEDVVKVLGLDDVILELELTPNRSDCLSMWNVAREVAALTGGKMKLPVVEEEEDSGLCQEMTRVEILEPELCKRYVARVVQDIKIAPSPTWIQQRLLAVGIRPINNIVDVTNYVMMETGQPLHAFDYDLLQENRIIVRKAQTGEEIISLDGQKRELLPEMLVIADAKRPVAIAGVMGGLETEITEKTKTMLLEAAYFNGASIRRTSHALGLRSESSLRFEKSVDIEKVDLAAKRAVQLLDAMNAGRKVPGRVDCYPIVEKREPIILRLARVNQILGTDISSETAEKILLSLQLNITKKSEGQWVIEPPSYRQDLEKEIDLIEEIARINGYDKIPTTLPSGITTQGYRTKVQRLRKRVRAILKAQTMAEVVQYSFINPKHLDRLRMPEDHTLRQAVVVQNPLSEEQGIMRTTLIPGLLETVVKNINKQNKNLNIFELGKVYLKKEFPTKCVLPEERWILGAVSTGKEEKSWLYPEKEYDYYHLKGIIENLFSSLRINTYNFVATNDVPWYHPGRTARIVVDGKEIGLLGEIHPLVLEKFALEQRVVVCTLDFEKLTDLVEEEISYQSVPRYPAVTRDLALLVPEDLSSGKVVDVIEKIGKEYLKEVRLFDIYTGKQIEAGHKSLAYSLTWQAKERTLTDDEVKRFHQEIEDALVEIGAVLRR